MASAEPAVDAASALAPQVDARLEALLPRPTPALSVQVARPVHVLSLRHLPEEGTSTLAKVLAVHGLPRLPAAGECLGLAPRLLWLSPNEVLLLTPHAMQAAALGEALRPMPGAFACAIDLSGGSLVLRLRGQAAEACLSRLVDVRSIPQHAGRASRFRLADIAVVGWRDAPDDAGLLVDRALGHHLARWLGHAASHA